MNEKFFILHEAAGAEWSIQNFEFIIHLASACICKQNTNLTVSNTFNIKSEFTACACKQKPYAFATKQNCNLKNNIRENSTKNMKNCSEQIKL